MRKEWDKQGKVSFFQMPYIHSMLKAFTPLRNIAEKRLVLHGVQGVAGSNPVTPTGTKAIS